MSHTRMTNRISAKCLVFQLPRYKYMYMSRFIMMIMIIVIIIII